MKAYKRGTYIGGTYIRTRKSGSKQAAFCISITSFPLGFKTSKSVNRIYFNISSRRAYIWGGAYDLMFFCCCLQVDMGLKLGLV